MKPRICCLPLIAPLLLLAASPASAKDTTDVARSRAAIRSCNIPELKSLIAAGLDINAVDDHGYDLLSYASRDFYPVAQTRLGIKKQFRLKCPEAVAVLTQAGADPQKASDYHNPKLDAAPPRSIAVISVQDLRETKSGRIDAVEKLASAVESGLKSRHYEVLHLTDVREKLRTAGFSEAETTKPDRVKACKTLGVGAVLETALIELREKNLGIISVGPAALEFRLTDCEGDGSLWRSLIKGTESRGFIVKALASAYDVIANEQIAIPNYMQ